MDTLVVRENVELHASKVIRVYGVWFNVSRILKFNHNFNLYMEHIIKIMQMATKLSKLNKSIKGHVSTNIIKSYVMGKIDYGAEVLRFSDAQYQQMDVRWRIFTKGQYCIRRSALNETI